MAFTPNPNLFNNAFGGGLQNGKRLADIFHQKKAEKQQGVLAQMFASGENNFDQLASQLAQMGKAREALQVSQTPYNREQAQAETARVQGNADRNFDFGKEKFAVNNEFRQTEVDRSQGNSNRAFALQSQQHADLLKYRASTLANKNIANYTTPIQAIGADGQPVFIQTNDRGEVKQLDGYTPNNPVKKVDTGTEILTIDNRTGDVIGRYKKNNQQAESDKAYGKITGKGQGEAQNSLNSLTSKMDGLRQVIGELRDLSGNATYTKTGVAVDDVKRQFGVDPSEAAIARQAYISKVDNQVLPLLRDIFGAAFTKAEGDSLRATLGNPNLSPPEKEAVLDAFIQQKERDVQALQNRVGNNSSQGNSPVDDLVSKYAD